MVPVCVAWAAFSALHGVFHVLHLDGFSTGDVILEVAGKSVSTPADVRDVVASARTEGKRTVLLRVKKGDNTRFVALPLIRS